MAPTRKCIRATIRKTQEILNKDGWCRGTYANTKNQHCLVGALFHAVPSQSDRMHTMLTQLILDEVTRSYGNNWNSLTAWNDEHRRRKSHVLRLLDRVLLNLENDNYRYKDGQWVYKKRTTASVQSKRCHL